MSRITFALIVALSGCIGSDATAPEKLPDPPVQVKSITIEAPETLQTGFPVTLIAVVVDASNTRVRNATLIWSSSDPSIATVSQQGVVEGKREGTVTITATLGLVEGTVTLRIVRGQCYYELWGYC